MFNSTNSPFTIPVTPYDGNRSDGFGDGNGWWIILFVLFFAFGGWGNGGWGGNGSNSSYYTLTPHCKEDLTPRISSENLMESTTVCVTDSMP